MGELMATLKTNLKKAVRSGRIRHSVCMWCYEGMSVDQMAVNVRQLGLQGIDLLRPDQWEPLKDNNLICTMTSGTYTIEKGLNRKENHPAILEELQHNIEATAVAGYPNV